MPARDAAPGDPARRCPRASPEPQEPLDKVSVEDSDASPRPMIIGERGLAEYVESGPEKRRERDLHRFWQRYRRRRMEKGTSWARLTRHNQESVTMKDTQSEGQDAGPVGEAGSKTDPKLGGRGASAMQGDTDTPTKFGTFAHESYGYAAEDKYGEGADVERRVGVTKPDGTLAEGEVDLIKGNALIDYKSNDMRGLDDGRGENARTRQHGQQMKEYVDSPDTPADAKGSLSPLCRLNRRRCAMRMRPACMSTTSVSS